LEALRFEEALKRLETIVESMEEGELPLDHLLAKYEEGTRLVKACQTRLDEADVKIKRLETTASGEPVLRALEDAETEEDE